MAEYRFHAAAVIGRSKGRSSTSAAAYRAAEKIMDERTGEIFDYRRKQGVERAELILPGGGTENRAKFWNALEKHHTRKDAVVAREFQLSLPHELTKAQRHELGLTFARELADKYGVAIDIAFHAPRKITDAELKALPNTEYAIDPETGVRNNKNYHAHLLISACHVSPSGEFGKKCVVLDKIHCEHQSPPIENVVVLERPRWEKAANAALEKAGRDERIDHRTLKAQGIDREATFHMGPHASAMQRKGKHTEISKRMMAIKEANQLQSEIKVTKEQVAAMKTEIRKEHSMIAAALPAQAAFSANSEKLTRSTAAKDTPPKAVPMSDLVNMQKVEKSALGGGWGEKKIAVMRLEGGREMETEMRESKNLGGGLKAVSLYGEDGKFSGTAIMRDGKMESYTSKRLVEDPRHAIRERFAARAEQQKNSLYVSNGGKMYSKSFLYQVTNGRFGKLQKVGLGEQLTVLAARAVMWTAKALVKTAFKAAAGAVMAGVEAHRMNKIEKAGYTKDQARIALAEMKAGGKSFGSFERAMDKAAARQKTVSKEKGKLQIRKPVQQQQRTGAARSFSTAARSQVKDSRQRQRQQIRQPAKQKETQKPQQQRPQLSR